MCVLYHEIFFYFQIHVSVLGPDSTLTRWRSLHFSPDCLAGLRRKEKERKDGMGREGILSCYILLCFTALMLLSVHQKP